MTLFKELATLCKKLEVTTKRKEKTKLISEFLHKLDESEIKPAILLIIGSVLPETDNRSLGSWTGRARPLSSGVT